jgi:hypothetical protein
MRSKFVHHGQNLDDIGTLARFLECPWLCLLEVLRLHDKFETRLELLGTLDAAKLSGGFDPSM